MSVQLEGICASQTMCQHECLWCCLRLLPGGCVAAQPIKCPMAGYDVQLKKPVTLLLAARVLHQRNVVHKGENARAVTWGVACKQQSIYDILPGCMVSCNRFRLNRRLQTCCCTNVGLSRLLLSAFSHTLTQPWQPGQVEVRLKLTKQKH